MCESVKPQERKQKVSFNSFQVVTLAVYSYFLSSIIGRQFIVNTSYYSEPFRRDYYVLLYTVLEFIVYMGWLKVVETLVNPIGEDDEDFYIIAIIGLNWSRVMLSNFSFVSFLSREEYGMRIVDSNYHSTELVRDIFWNSANVSLLHTADSKKLHSSQMVGSVFNIDVFGTNPHDRNFSACSAVNLHTSCGSEDHHGILREPLRLRLKPSNGLEMHNLPDDSSSTPCSIQSSVISPSTNAGEATLPVLAEVDEESNPDVKGHPGTSRGDGGEQNQIDDQDGNISTPENEQITSKPKNSFSTMK
ncbi:unnamed protein product [Taenia asiatica]|uniref:Bestrophin homolog n=1 Tax=Taenia asiatica TaxID=60517 RepID=A0A0R3WEB7_TAEAS|nr:unnamed protein product [Taenia asiatica]